ncbi:type I secretion system permease/ATPase [Jiella sp. M17.18]|uniref:type I secretion system permease/ATPase n=1 Tax=Jiella sp. M17.18 TaxID=3234247 RepID=UPI0034DFD01E
MTSSPLATAMRSILPGMCGIFAFSLIVNLLLLVQPIYMLQVYDRVLSSGSLDTLLYISLIAVGALILLGILDAVRGFIAARLSMRLTAVLGERALLASMQGPRASLGDTQPLRDLAVLRSFIGGKTIFAYLDLPFAPIFIGLLYFVHPALFFLTLGGAAALVALAFVNHAVTTRLAEPASAHAAAAILSAQSFVRNAESIGAMGMTGSVARRWGLWEAGSLSVQDRTNGFAAFFAGTSRTVRLGLQVAILGVGGYLTLSGEMTAGMIFASSLISGRGLQPIDQVIAGWRSLADARASWGRLDEALRSVSGRRSGTELPDPAGDLHIDNLVVLAPGGGAPDPLLKRIEARISAGQCLAIIGPSGAGKSTLAQAIVGNLRARSGAVRIDGSDIDHWDREMLGRFVGYVPQDCEILPGTIAENIGRFDPEAEDRAVVRAAERAQVHAMIQKLPLGYDTLIGPSGLRLSGGQRQRIALARAFYGAPRLLVLDEPNANLDRDGEAALEEAVAQAKADGVTVVMITQRMGIVEKADLVMILREGAVEAFGKTEDVLSRLRDDAVRRRAQPLPTVVAAGSRRASSRPASTIEQVRDEVARHSLMGGAA